MCFLDGSKIDDWFSLDIDLNMNKKIYYLSKYIKDINRINTDIIQQLIDDISLNGGGILYVDGIYTTGSLFFKNGVDLYIDKDAKLLGSTDILDYPLTETRIEGETCIYYSALINFINTSGNTIFGSGIIDGMGQKAWQRFWNRLKWNKKATNKDEQRARLLYIADSNNITISGITLQNSMFWTCHIYRSKYIKIFNAKFYSPSEPIKAPSTDAIDLDYTSYIHIKNCYMDVNDDAIALKGGKGQFADKDENNGMNEKIIIEDSKFNFCHSCLTCGSEAIHNKNIILRNIEVIKAKNILWLKMRPDTPQIYEYILCENINGFSNVGLNINPWIQFNNIEDNNDIPLSYSNNITFKNFNLKCNNFFYVKLSDQYKLNNFNFINLNIETKINNFKEDIINNTYISNVNIININE